MVIIEGLELYQCVLSGSPSVQEMWDGRTDDEADLHMVCKVQLRSRNPVRCKNLSTKVSFWTQAQSFQFKF